MTSKFILLIMATACLGLMACETLNGAGRDIENAGETVQDAAKK